MKIQFEQGIPTYCTYAIVNAQLWQSQNNKPVHYGIWSK